MMKYPKTIIKFEGELKTTMAQEIRGFLVDGGKTVHWTDSHELTVVHKEGKKRGEIK
jgi:hypothetical protein